MIRNSYNNLCLCPCWLPCRIHPTSQSSETRKILSSITHSVHLHSRHFSGRAVTRKRHRNSSEEKWYGEIPSLNQNPPSCSFSFSPSRPHIKWLLVKTGVVRSLTQSHRTIAMTSSRELVNKQMLRVPLRIKLQSLLNLKVPPLFQLSVS